MEVDTGACTSLITKDEYIHFYSHLNLQKVTCVYSSVTDDNLKDLGKLSVRVKPNSNIDKYFDNMDLVLVQTDKVIMPLMGRSWLDQLFPN